MTWRDLTWTERLTMNFELLSSECAASSGYVNSIRHIYFTTILQIDP